MDSVRTFFASTPKGIEPLLAEELRQLGADSVVETRAGVSFSGPIAVAYRACLWSRLASRVFLPLAEFPAATPEELYAGVQTIAWQDHLAPDSTLAIDCALVASTINHSHFAALKAKDAIVDQFRDRCGIRPSIETWRPALRINLYLNRDRATVSLDLSGESLHRRGYREEGAMAPLKENLAAALLIRAGWPAIAAAGGTFLDPMCGSGTLPLEAALLAGDIAPGLLREYYGFFGWLDHQPAVWQELVAEAEARRAAGLTRIPKIIGYDAEPWVIKAAWSNAERIGLQTRVHFERRAVEELVLPTGQGVAPGLVLVNPPYGERLGVTEELKGLYRALGTRLKEEFSGWRAAVFTSNPDLGKSLGIRAHRLHVLYNGALKCQLIHLEIKPESFIHSDRLPRSQRPEPVILGAGAEMFANRVRKNVKAMGKWARQSGVSCFRLYDADLPEYAVAIDLYEQWAYVQEYAPPKTVEAAVAAQRTKEVMAVLPEVLALPPEAIFFKVRERQRGTAQYRKYDDQGELHEVGEGNCRFLVNFQDYLDTGLFLDHRPTRQLVQDLSFGKRFLNLFAYTGSATVHAAMGGAAATTTVDMSKTYLAWAKKNMALNGFTDPRHEYVEANCLEWLRRQSRRFDLIFLDPPTFSNSKSMTSSFDVQRDHVGLLQAAAKLLAKEGVLIFSNNNRHFKMAIEELPELEIVDITPQTIAKDFARNPRIHNCWRITRR